MKAGNPSALALEPEADPFVRILSRLRSAGCKYRLRSADSVRAQCPAHADANPSLLVTRLENRVVVKCFAGCQKSHVLRALNLVYADLYYGPRRPLAKPQIVATYAYTDLAGHVLAEKVRTSNKKFRWRTPDGVGGWRWGLNGQGVTLYGLPDLVDAREVLKVEGEKGRDRLHAAGFTATCGPAGAAHWQDAYADLLWRLGCREVVILPDADQAGRSHARQVAASCYGRVGGVHGDRSDEGPWTLWPSASPTDADVAPLLVKVVDLPNLPPGGDAVDFLDRHSPDDLRTLIHSAPYWSPELDDTRRRDRRRELTRERVRRKRARDRAANLRVTQRISAVAT